jgi:hypothetical protein
VFHMFDRQLVSKVTRDILNTRDQQYWLLVDQKHDWKINLSVELMSSKQKDS